jgi:DNA-binding transcriptional regulator YhcF (GntR family)
VDEETLPDAESLAPPYLHIAETLRDEIRDGRYRVGERIPSQAELEERFQVSRPTVQRALGVLRKDGYIDNQRGRASEVLPWQRATPAGAAPLTTQDPEPAFEALATYVAAAFEEREVTIDCYSLTSETLNGALAVPVQSALRGELNPAVIRVRVLLPTQDAVLALPRLVADPDDDRPLRRLRQLSRAHGIALRSTFTGLSEVRPEIKISVEFRALPVTPMQKLYLLNQRLALSGFYRVQQHPVTFGDGQKDEIYDVVGLKSVLFAHRMDPAKPKSRDSLFVAESQAWFDSLWSTIAEPVPLFE